MRAILDTSGWYAYILEADEFHRKAVEFVKRKPKLTLPYPVLEELIALLHHREGKKKTTAALDALRRLSDIELVFLGNEEEKQIWKLYKKTANKINYVDASIIWLAKRMDLPIFSFDAHFKKLNLQLVPQV